MTDDDPQDDKPQELFEGRYRLDSPIAQGGFGRVWRGFDEKLRRPVAVKVPRSGRHTGPEQIEQFLAEARTLARLDHPGIVPVFDVVHHQGKCVIVLGLVEGIDLVRYGEGRPLPVPEVARIVADVADALEYAHRLGVIHRDIKPANILLDRAHRVYLTDFGIAAASDEPNANDCYVHGTVPYMAPEQLAGQVQGNARSDIYSLGVILHELVTCFRPGDVTPNLRGKRSGDQAPAPPAQRRAMPPVLECICRKCLAENPAERYASAEEVAAALRRSLGGLLVEADWLACNDVEDMLTHLYTVDVSARKVRLFACGCARQDPAFLLDSQNRRIVEIAERYADGQATDTELEIARSAAWKSSAGTGFATDRKEWSAAIEATRITPRHVQTVILIDLFGTLHFRHPPDFSAWLESNGGTVRKLAKTIYEQRSFDRMPALAEALEQAGCANNDLLDHCRQAGEHFRGCWVLDLLLGEE
jgi:serine/threonine protein kinase